MSTRASIFLTDDDEHWYRELDANDNYGMETEGNWCFVFEFDRKHVIDLDKYTLEVAIDPESPLGQKLSEMRFNKPAPAKDS